MLHSLLYDGRKRKSPTAAAATLLLSAEETAMDGAPKGAVYQVGSQVPYSISSQYIGLVDR